MKERSDVECVQQVLPEEIAMKVYRLLAVATLVLMTGCAQQLSVEDRALLNETRAMAMDAKNEASRAATAAQQAQASAAQSAASAKTASEKADRIFRQSGVK